MQFMVLKIKRLHTRAASWAGAISIGPPVLFLACALILRDFISENSLSGRGAFAVYYAIGAIEFPGFLASYLFGIPVAAMHGPTWLIFLPMPFVNWLFYYYVVFRPLFQWRQRRNARKQAGETPRTT
jgi:hypothetical protein